MEEKPCGSGPGALAPPLGADGPAGAAGGQSSEPAAGAAAVKPLAADTKFGHEAAAAAWPRRTGKLAAEKATNPEVKQFGQRMVDDHSKANDELKAYATQKGVTLPARSGRRRPQTVEARLSKLRRGVRQGLHGQTW